MIAKKKKTLKLLSDNRQNISDYSMVNCPANLKKKPETIVFKLINNSSNLKKAKRDGGLETGSQLV